MKNYIKLEGNKIINWYQSTQERQDTEITTEQYNYLSYKENKYYTYENNIIKEFDRDDEDYKNKIRNEKINAIISNTKVLIESKGFIYDDIKYGCTSEDQNNWNTLVNTILTTKMLGVTDEQIFPIENEVKDWEGNLVTMPSLEYINNIIMTGKEHVNTYRISQKVLIDLINDATTIEQLNAIIDNRA